MLPRFRIHFCVLLAVTLVGCGFTKKRDAAAQAVEEFHRQQTAGEFRQIYAAASPQFKAAASEADFLTLAERIEGALGRFKSGNQAGWHVDVKNGRTTVDLVYQSTFEKGEAEEKFSYTMESSEAPPLLQGYHVNSPLLK